MFMLSNGNSQKKQIPTNGLFAHIDETVLERTLNGNENAFDEFYEYFVNTCLPNVLSDVARGDLSGAVGSLGVLGVVSHMMANRDFIGKPIESGSQLALEPKDRYNARTSKIAYWMGHAFNISPVKADYLFQNILGGWWKTQRALFPVGSSP